MDQIFFFRVNLINKVDSGNIYIPELTKMWLQDPKEGKNIVHGMRGNAKSDVLSNWTRLIYILILKAVKHLRVFSA